MCPHSWLLRNTSTPRLKPYRLISSAVWGFTLMLWNTELLAALSDSQLLTSWCPWYLRGSLYAELLSGLCPDAKTEVRKAAMSHIWWWFCRLVPLLWKLETNGKGGKISGAMLKHEGNTNTTKNSERKNLISVLKDHSCPYHSAVAYFLLDFFLNFLLPSVLATDTRK